jgi:hypothetical protein
MLIDIEISVRRPRQSRRPRQESMMMEDKIEKLLDIMADIVNDDDQLWTEKRDLIRNMLKDDDRKIIFDEFIGWFPDEEG